MGGSREKRCKRAAAAQTGRSLVRLPEESTGWSANGRASGLLKSAEKALDLIHGRRSGTGSGALKCCNGRRDAQ